MKNIIVSGMVFALLAGGCATVTKPVPPKATIDPASGKACFQCHRSKITGEQLHQALADMECTPCHAVSPGNHQADNKLFAVKDKGAKLCWECHDSPKGAKSVHPVIEADGCIACHQPHTAALPHLLKRGVPNLCFDCHDKDMAKDKETAKGTSFRDGQQNLHYVHATKNQVACLTCHDVHASPQEHLVRPKATSGKEAVTLTYTASPKGGSCTTSCHDQLSYERK